MASVENLSNLASPGKECQAARIEIFISNVALGRRIFAATISKVPLSRRIFTAAISSVALERRISAATVKGFNEKIADLCNENSFSFVDTLIL